MIELTNEDLQKVMGIMKMMGKTLYDDPSIHHMDLGPKVCEDIRSVYTSVYAKGKPHLVN